MRKYHDLSKKNEKKVHISSFGQEKAHKKNLYTSQLGNAEEKIKEKYI